MGEILEPIFKGFVVAFSQYINWNAVLEWTCVFLLGLFYVGAGVLSIYIAYKIISYPMKQMKRRNDLLEQMLKEMRSDKDKE